MYIYIYLKFLVFGMDYFVLVVQYIMLPGRFSHPLFQVFMSLQRLYMFVLQTLVMIVVLRKIDLRPNNAPYLVMINV